MRGPRQDFSLAKFSIRENDILEQLAYLYGLVENLKKTDLLLDRNKPPDQQ